MKISVTADHIINGKRAKCMECPVALALRDAGVKGVKVGSLAFYRENDEYSEGPRVEHPYRVLRFIEQFDTHRVPGSILQKPDLSPFEFEVDLSPLLS